MRATPYRNISAGVGGIPFLGRRCLERMDAGALVWWMVRGCLFLVSFLDGAKSAKSFIHSCENQREAFVFRRKICLERVEATKLRLFSLKGPEERRAGPRKV